MSLYRIKPLKWERSFSDDCQTYRASTTFGSFEVQRTNWDGDGWGDWMWSYCFDEYYDEAREACSSAVDGKRRCEKHWIARLESVLEIAEEPPQ